MKIEIGNNFSSTYYDSWWHENVFQIKRLGVLHSGFDNMPTEYCIGLRNNETWTNQTQ